MEINNYSNFLAALDSCGFSMGGGNDKGIFAVIPYGWENQDLIDSPVKWHTGDSETDPWEWRMRVLEEQDNIAYAKVFFRTSGYITKKWYPYFYAVRTKGEVFEESFYNGSISQSAKDIYEIISQKGKISLHEIKTLGGFTKENKSAFDRALVELQMKMFITMCGRQQKKNKLGEGYGWESTVFTTVEDFWSERNFIIPKIDEQEAIEKIKEQIYKLNPNADIKKINKFIKG